MPIGLPDLRDGLTAPTRHLLRLVDEATRKPNGRLIKTNRIIQKAITKDPAVKPTDWYPHLLRLERPWVCRYPLFEAQGNIGSIDGAPPCGMQFNEVGITKWGRLLLSPEPVGSAFPHLLCNGAWAHSGDFVNELDGDSVSDSEIRAHLAMEGEEIGAPNVVPTGGMEGGTMESFLPAHNLGELCAALEFLLDHPGASLPELLRILRGPDFPTGGVLLNDTRLEGLYQSGEGDLIVAGRVTFEDLSGGRSLVTIREIPYGVGKTDLIKKAAHRVREGWLAGVADIRDLSFGAGVQVEIEVRARTDPHKIVEQLHGMELLQTRIQVKMIVSDGGAARQADLLDLMKSHLEGRRQCLRRGSSDADVDRLLRVELRGLAGESDRRRTSVGG